MKVEFLVLLGGLKNLGIPGRYNIPVFFKNKNWNTLTSKLKLAVIRPHLVV